MNNQNRDFYSFSNSESDFGTLIDYEEHNHDLFLEKQKINLADHRASKTFIKSFKDDKHANI